MHVATGRSPDEGFSDDGCLEALSKKQQDKGVLNRLQRNIGFGATQRPTPLEKNNEVVEKAVAKKLSDE